MTSLDGAHVLVTGGSQGIGLATARLCAARGARVTLLARTPSLLAEAAALTGADVVVADVTDATGLRAALAGLDRVDVLVCSAGAAEPGRFLEQDDDALRRSLALNLEGAAACVRAVLPGMLAAGRGHVVLVSSVAAVCGVYGYSSYAPAKAGLLALAGVLEAEHRDDGLRVTVVLPPDTLTPGFAREGASKPPETAAVSALVPPVAPEVVARALVRGVESDRRTVTTDAGTALLAAVPGLVGPGLRAVLRRTVRRAQRSR